MIKYIKYRITI